MPVNIRIFHAADLVRANPEGEATVELAQRLVRDIVAAGACLEDFEVLVDVRRITKPLSAAELWLVAETLSKVRRGRIGNKTAVVCPAQRWDHIHFFSLCAEKEGHNVRGFTSYEDAMEWLLAPAG